MYILNTSPHNRVFRFGSKSVLIRGTSGMVGAMYLADGGAAYTEVTPEAAEICRADPEWSLSRCLVAHLLPEGMPAYQTEVQDHSEPATDAPDDAPATRVHNVPRAR